MENAEPERQHVYRTITDRIIEAIKAGAEAFVMPWHSFGAAHTHPTNAVTGHRYSGGNVIGLWAEAMLSGYSTGTWATYRQWREVGAQVRLGERGSVIVFYKVLPREEDDEQSRFGFARASYVFNADQVDGWKQTMSHFPEIVRDVPEVEAFVAKTKAKVVEGFRHAAYNRLLDRIELPERMLFLDTPTRTATEAYYGVLLHELVHWTGASNRLDRTFGRSFGDAEYAAEELVAEIGSAFLCGDLGLANVPRPDHAAYVAHWLSILEDDHRAIFTAARLATNAARYLHGNVPYP